MEYSLEKIFFSKSKVIIYTNWNSYNLLGGNEWFSKKPFYRDYGATVPRMLTFVLLKSFCTDKVYLSINTVIDD